jgi:hypothetical protein
MNADKIRNEIDRIHRIYRKKNRNRMLFKLLDLNLLILTNLVNPVHELIFIGVYRRSLLSKLARDTVRRP